MTDSKVKVEYTAVPFEDVEKTSGSKKVEGKTLPNNDNLPNYFVSDTTYDCYFRRYYEKRKVWSKTLILILLVFFASKILFGWLAFYELNDEDQYIWMETSNNDLKFPIASVCTPFIKWEGPSEILVDQKNTSGLIFKIKGPLPNGSVTILQDPQAKDYIKITNHIYVGDESLQKKVHIKIGYFEDDYLVTVETPTFNFPPNRNNCIRIDTIITIPHTVKFFRSLSVDVPNSLIKTDLLGGVDFAYVNLKTTNGLIDIDKLTVANADVSTVNGRIHGSFIIGESLEVRSINGGSNVDVIPNSQSDHVFVGVSTFNGNLNIDVNELMEHHKFDLKAHSINGGIVTTVPETYKGDFLVSSITGYTYVEGKGITFRKNSLNHKEGYKGDNNKSANIKRHNCKYVKQSFDENNSNLNLTIVDGTSELYFK